VIGKFGVPAFKAVDTTGTFSTGVERFSHCGTDTRSEDSIPMGSESYLFSRLFKTLAETLSLSFNSVFLDGF
jgi:hypothetical protein